MDKITVVCHKDHDRGYEDFQGKCLLCEVENFGREIGRLNKQVEELTGLYHLAQSEQEPVAKVWLWRNFVNDKPEYWAFDNPYPINLDNDDPQTIGSPCGYALLKPSRDGSRGRKEDEVLREIKGALAREQTRHQPLAKPEYEPVAWRNTETGEFCTGGFLLKDLAKWTPLFTAPPKREWVGLTEDEVAQAMYRADAIVTGPMQFKFAEEIEAKLKEKNHANNT